MNSKAYHSLLLISLTTIYPTISYSYNYDSHKRLSEEIAINSSLKSRLLPWGLKSMEDKLTFYSNDDRFADMTQSVMEWLRYGTEQEDAILSFNPARFRNHFYDPISKSGYFYYGLSGEQHSNESEEYVGWAKLAKPNISLFVGLPVVSPSYRTEFERGSRFEPEYSFGMSILIPTFFSILLRRIS